MNLTAATSHSAEPGRISLSAGQPLWLHMRRGDALVTADTGVTLTEAPRWLAERCVQTARRLDAHAPYVIEHGGWVSVQARRPSQLTWLARAPRGAWLARFGSWVRRPVHWPARPLTR